MNRITKCLRFEAKNMLKSTLWFIVIYSFASIGLFSIIYTSAGNSTFTFNSGLFIGAAFFAFVYVLSDYRSSFNYLLINGNTRKTIFLSTTIANVILSAILAVLSYIFDFIDTFVSKSLAGSVREGITLIEIMYPNSSKALELPYMAALLIMLTSFAMLYGALAYRFGKYFITVFWVCFGIAFMALPLSSAAANIIKFIEAFMYIGKTNGILLAPINFIATALVFSAAAYLISYHQPQTAPVP